MVVRRRPFIALAVAGCFALTGCGKGLDEPSGPMLSVSATSPTAATTTETTSSGSTASSPQESASQESPEPASTKSGSIFTSPGNGYNCPGTDAWVEDKKYCTPENLGGEPFPFDDWEEWDDWELDSDDEYDDWDEDDDTNDSDYSDYDEYEDYDDYSEYDSDW
ncbi:hypothetical protein [Corynebacterium urinipleomorphum]|uniref:hypothetical protein n=1 Tax=Corynebacterium urinipleomorphum TaxID=1852380 RepID=UPI000B350A7F|nr:hypothetical protein [Corynebacterium urinipleomorphum]